jgi:hypothetical protein
MTVLESRPVESARSPEELFAFLSDISNYRSLMPPQVEGWQAEGDRCRFEIKGMARLGMRIAGRTPVSEVRLESTEPSPFPFAMACRVKPAGERGSSLVIGLEADLNPMLRMLASEPLTRFLNHLAERCAAA